MAFLAPDQSRVLTIADQRMDYVFSGVPGALVGESGPLPWEAHVGEAAALFAEILEIVGIGAHRIAFVAEEISRDMPGRTPASAVRDRLVANPGNWELGNEWEWKVQTQRPAALERINVLLSAGGVSGEQNGAPFTGLRRLFDLNTPSESARPRFTASALPEALTGLVAVARIVESETTEFFQHGD